MFHQLFHPDCVAGFQGFFKTCAEYGLLLEFFHQFPLVSGVFEVVYGSNKVVSFSGDGAHITLRWISRRGELDSYEFCIYQDSRKLENIQTAGIGGLTYKLAFDQINKITLFAAMLDRETFENFTAIQESAIVQASVPDGWYNVEVEVKEYKRTKAALQDFDITIVLPNER